MCKLLRTTILITFGLLIIGIASGCGDNLPEEVTDSPQLENDVGPPATEVVVDSLENDVGPPATEVVVDPPPRASTDAVLIPRNTQFTLTFNESVIAVTVNDTPASGSGINWEWSAQPVLPYGSVTLTIKWTNRDGSGGFATSGPYEAADVDPVPPEITSGTVADGDADVDPGPINAGGFRFDFNHAVTGTIKLADEAGVDLNWVATVAGQRATLTAVAGQELANETTYRIEIEVKDGAGNQLQGTITFVTKPK